MLPSIEELKASLEKVFPGVAFAVEGAAIIVPVESFSAAAVYLRDADGLKFDYLSNLTAVDYPPERIDVVYHLSSMALKHGPITLKVKLPRATPAVASAVPVWRTAEFQEREVYDLYGVAFEGHPDLRRILMWDEFVGFPMRKDFQHEDQDAPA